MILSMYWKSTDTVSEKKILKKLGYFSLKLFIDWMSNDKCIFAWLSGVAVDAPTNLP